MRFIIVASNTVNMGCCSSNNSSAKYENITIGSCLSDDEAAAISQDLHKMCKLYAQLANIQYSSLNLGELKCSAVTTPKWVSSKPTYSKNFEWPKYTMLPNKGQHSNITVEREEEMYESIQVTRGYLFGLSVESTAPRNIDDRFNPAGKKTSLNTIKKTSQFLFKSSDQIILPNCCYTGRFTCCLRLRGQVIFREPEGSVQDLHKTRPVAVQDPFIGAIVSCLQLEDPKLCNMFVVDGKDVVWRVEANVEQRWITKK
ncbi:uncharacterized protein LOC131935870 [Physella acuta]|uniref:uncharacterized protein LOC131935870 n=1 Tax=Physella acuta TaxID=109671 RepID=UPI0027DDBF54|nr:uncharacterized protein LOC131935870 [Physella acuta]